MIFLILLNLLRIIFWYYTQVLYLGGLICIASTFTRSWVSFTKDYILLLTQRAVLVRLMIPFVLSLDFTESHCCSLSLSGWQWVSSSCTVTWDQCWKATRAHLGSSRDTILVEVVHVAFSTTRWSLGIQKHWIILLVVLEFSRVAFMSGCWITTTFVARALWSQPRARADKLFPSSQVSSYVAVSLSLKILGWWLWPLLVFVYLLRGWHCLYICNGGALLLAIRNSVVVLRVSISLKSTWLWLARPSCTAWTTRRAWIRQAQIICV
jgi:hypothetical protein